MWQFPFKVSAHGKAYKMKSFTSWIQDLLEKIYLFYDSDMLGNTAVYNQSIALLKAIEITFSTIQTYHAVWKKEWGKGIDDMYFNGHIKK